MAIQDIGLGSTKAGDKVYRYLHEFASMFGLGNAITDVFNRGKNSEKQLNKVINDAVEKQINWNTVSQAKLRQLENVLTSLETLGLNPAIRKKVVDQFPNLKKRINTLEQQIDLGNARIDNVVSKAKEAVSYGDERFHKHIHDVESTVNNIVNSKTSASK